MASDDSLYHEPRTSLRPPPRCPRPHAPALQRPHAYSYTDRKQFMSSAVSKVLDGDREARVGRVGEEVAGGRVAAAGGGIIRPFV
ncbi:hypothetical protein E2C01_011006 [Portunus trituberculatus]|uniref:Uncharacterized protein n=1 Tax=Portunus trituberculatus TaxID=210409 RepID=A0A5B7DA45_PORTR|nr:hypothetical protein [Portunus trituberculatus]